MSKDEALKLAKTSFPEFLWCHAVPVDDGCWLVMTGSRELALVDSQETEVYVWKKTRANSKVN